MVEEHVPLGSPRDYNEPWMNRSIMKIWKKKNCAWSRLRVRNSRERWRVYRKHPPPKKYNQKIKEITRKENC